MNKTNSLPFLQVSDFYSAVSLWTWNSPNKFTKCYLLSKQPHGRQCDGCPFVDMSSLALMFSVHIGTSGKESTLGFLKAFPRSSEESRPSICCACSCSNKVFPSSSSAPEFTLVSIHLTTPLSTCNVRHHFLTLFFPLLASVVERCGKSQLSVRWSENKVNCLTVRVLKTL